MPPFAAYISVMFASCDPLSNDTRRGKNLCFFADSHLWVSTSVLPAPTPVTQSQRSSPSRIVSPIKKEYLPTLQGHGAVLQLPPFAGSSGHREQKNAPSEGVRGFTSLFCVLLRFILVTATHRDWTLLFKSKIRENEPGDCFHFQIFYRFIWGKLNRYLVLGLCLPSLNRKCLLCVKYREPLAHEQLWETL